MEDKFVIILNKKIETGTALNAASHMAAALVQKANTSRNERMCFLNYQDASDQSHMVSGLSLIVLKAPNSNKLRVARNLAIDQKILHTDFVESMTGDTYIQQMERTKTLQESELEYFGLAMFGEKSKIDTITAKFSLWR